MGSQVKTREPEFWINPNFRLHFPTFHVEWYKVNDAILRQEAEFPHPDRMIYLNGGQCVMLITRTDHSAIDIVYSDSTNFKNLRLQKWLRETIRDQITLRANIVLPRRLHEQEVKHNLYAKSVVIKKLRKNILGQCSSYKVIFLSPMLVIFPQALMDSTILHEMAHLKHLNHRKPFWDFLSTLLGEDARHQKAMQDVALSKYMAQYQFLMK